MNAKRIALICDAAQRARIHFVAHTDAFVVVGRGVIPIRHIEVPGQPFEWAILDGWCQGPSNYAGPDDAAEDIASTAIKPPGELRPIAMKDWYPLYVKQLMRSVEEAIRDVPLTQH